MDKEITLKNDVKVIKKDRMRFTKNTLSSSLCYLAILFNVFYFVSVYSSNIGNYYYNMTIGFSIVYNLLFLLFTFLCSEGVKNYSKGYSIFITAIGVMQIVRIFYLPANAHSDLISLENELITPMDDKQYALVVVYLAVSAALCITAGVIGIIKHHTLEQYKKETGLN